MMMMLCSPLCVLFLSSCETSGTEFAPENQKIQCRSVTWMRIQVSQAHADGRGGSRRDESVSLLHTMYCREDELNKAMASSNKELSLASLSRAQRRKLQALSRPQEIGATIGVLNMILTAVIAVRFPAYYWIWHLARTSFYIPTRYVRFRQQGWELYLLDWCYVVTYLSNVCAILAFVRVTTGLSTVLVNYNAELIHAGFAMACGPLAWSVFVFRNSVVFHDVDHSTSVFIHLSPVVMFWCLRWGAGLPSTINDNFPSMFQVCGSPDDFFAADACLQSWRGWFWCNACPTSVNAFVAPPAVLYFFVWAAPYYFLVLMHWREWIEKTHRQTLFTYFCETQPDLMEACQTRLEPFVGERSAKPMGYMLMHMAAMIGLCVTAYFMWHSFLLHSLLLLAVLVKAIDNGSSYMFRVFAYRHAQDSLEHHRAKLE